MAKRTDEEEEEDEEPESEEEDKPSRKGRQQKKSVATVSLYEPMFVWIALLLIAVVLKILISNTALVAAAGSQVYGLANIYSSFILQFPGTVILPLIIGAVIGAEVGIKSTAMRSAMKNGLLNGIYASVIYLITVIVIYMIINYTTPQYASSVYTTVTQNIAAPIFVFLVTLEVFAVLSHLRRVE